MSRSRTLAIAASFSARLRLQPGGARCNYRVSPATGGRNQARGAAGAEAVRDTDTGSAQFLRADMGDAAEVCALVTRCSDGARGSMC
jgi:hypothetical protein